MSFEYFGKGCEYFLGQWEEDDSKEEGTPILVFCKHYNNHSSSEGNCNKDECPKQHATSFYEIY